MPCSQILNKYKNSLFNSTRAFSFSSRNTFAIIHGMPLQIANQLAVNYLITLVAYNECMRSGPDIGCHYVLKQRLMTN